LPLQSDRSVFRIKLLAAFAAVYFVWGSTYLFIHFALNQLPPFVLAATRFLIAGTILFAWSRLHGASTPRRPEWKAALITGGLFFLCGNGALVWAQQRLPSGIAALLVAIVPLWVVLLEWARPPHRRPARLVLVGTAIGLVGLVLLVGPGALTRAGPSIQARRSCWPAARSAGLMSLLAGVVLITLGSTRLSAAPEQAHSAWIRNNRPVD
jgi:drug/metabolite transporter (DMT)-like permease